MSFIIEKILEKLNKTNPDIPVVVRDPDNLLSFLNPKFEENGWKVIHLESLVTEFFTMCEAEKLNHSQIKTMINIGEITEQQLVHLAEYWDRGNGIEITLKSFFKEIGIDPSQFNQEILSILFELGMNQEMDWWDRLYDRGVNSLQEEIEDLIFLLLEDPDSLIHVPPTHQKLLRKFVLPVKFNLNIPDEVQWPEISNRLAENTFQSFFLSQPGEDIRNFYLSWEDSLSNEESLMRQATKFEKHFYDQLIETMETFYDNHRHPFPQIEKEIFIQKIKDIIENREPQSAFKFAKERIKKRKRNQYDKKNKIYWGELIELECLLEEVQIDPIQNLSSFIHEYEQKLWRFDNLDRTLSHSPLPHAIRNWAKKKINQVKKRINEKWQELFQPESISSEQIGFIYKTLQQNGKQAIIVVDALRYEVAQEINPSQGIKKEIRGIFATLPSITSVGMAALFSSGKVNRIMNEKNSFLIVDQQTDIPLDTVENRKKNIQKLIDGVEFYDFQSLPEELCEKCVITTRCLDDLGHDELIKYTDLFIQDIHQVIVLLIEKGFTIDIISDHGFYYFGTDPKISQIDEDAFETASRYKLLNHHPHSGVVEVFNDHIFIQYASDDTVFQKSSKNFWHGGASIQEILIPVITFLPIKETMKRSVKIYNKEHLDVVRRNKIEVILYSDTIIGEPRQVYLEVNQKRFEVDDLIQSETVKRIINLDIKDGDFFVIEVRDYKDGTLLDQVKGRYEPLREKYF
jgi:hypothetical protein